MSRSQVQDEGVRTNLKKMRLLLSVGLALSVAGASIAAERTRGASSDKDVSRVSSPQEPAGDFIVTGPDTARIEHNGVSVSVRADGFINLADIMSEYGSYEDYLLALELSRVAAAPGPGGTIIAANGLIYASSDFVGSGAPGQPVPRSFEDYKDQMTWASEIVDGTEHVVFADGSIGLGQLAFNPASSRDVLTVIGFNGEEIAADGSVGLP